MFAVEYGCLLVDLGALGICYLIYREQKKCLTAVKSAPVFEIDSSLQSKVVNNNVPYAIVKGTVKANSQPILSNNAKHLPGVIQKILVREHTVTWSAFARYWTEVKKDVSESTNVVPFSLIGTDDRSAVEVTSPLKARRLSMMTVYDVFKPSTTGVWSAITGFFIGERSKGFQHIELMLTEGTVLTGVGKLVLESGKVRIEPPSGANMDYFLITDSEKHLMSLLEDDMRHTKIICAILGVFGAAILARLIYRTYRFYRRLAEMESQNRQFQRLINRRNAARDVNLSRDVICLVCMDKPREVLIVRCGHFCCCLDCCEKLDPAVCPICRGPIDYLIPAFVS